MPTLFHYDNFDQCMLKNVEALYCTISFKLNPQNSTKSNVWNLIQVRLITRSIKIKNHILQDYNSLIGSYRHDIQRFGVCVHENCVKAAEIYSKTRVSEEFQRAIEACHVKDIEKYGFTSRVTKINCFNNEPKYSVHVIDKLFM